LTEQAVSPYDPSISGNEGLIWVRDDGYLIFTDQTNTNHVIPLESVNGFPSIGSGILNTANGSGGWSATDLIHSYTVSTLNSLQIDWPEGIPGGGKTANILIGNNSQNITASVGRPSGVETNEIIFNSGLSGI